MQKNKDQYLRSQFASSKRDRTNCHHKLLTCLVIFTLILPSQAISQNEDPDLIERTAERTSEITDRQVDFSDIPDALDRLQNYPVNLNNTSVEELSQLVFLTGRQISNLFIYIMTYGTVYSVYELKVVDGFDSATIRKMLPFVIIGKEAEKHPLLLKDILHSGRNQLLLRFEQVLQHQAGYHVPDSVLEKTPNAGYEGSPSKLYFRYTYSFYNRLLIGMSGEKDPGEQFFKGNQKYGMDFYSGFISLQNTGMLKQFTLGNFNVDFGQGLTLSSGISSTSVPGTGNVRRFGRGVVPSQSVNEGNYLRGAAVVLKGWNFRLSLFLSSHKRDANMLTADTSDRDEPSFSAFTETGYHRLPKEIDDKNSLHESIYGGNLNFRNQFLSIGITGFRSRWSAELNPKTQPYNIFNFRGRENLNVGMDFQASIKNTFVFGECSMSANGGTAFLTGIQVNPDPRLMFSLAIRDYQRNYQDLLSNAMGQNSTNSNEEGVLFTFSAGILPKLDLTGYVDLFRFPWLKYRTDDPSQGSEYQLQTDYTCSGPVKMHFRFRARSKQLNAPPDLRPVHTLEEVRSISWIYQADCQVSDALQLKSRFDLLRNRNGAASPAFGYLISQNLAFKLPKSHLTINFLYALFDTDTYNERIYAYENDVLYGYSVPAYFGKGIRYMLLLSWSPSRWFEIWAKYGQTWYSDRNTIGSGLDLINGSTKSEVELQVRLKF
jgi:hypothetical protein